MHESSWCLNEDAWYFQDAWGTQIVLLINVFCNYSIESFGVPI